MAILSHDDAFNENTLSHFFRLSIRQMKKQNQKKNRL